MDLAGRQLSSRPWNPARCSGQRLPLQAVLSVKLLIFYAVLSKAPGGSHTIAPFLGFFEAIPYPDTIRFLLKSGIADSIADGSLQSLHPYRCHLHRACQPFYHSLVTPQLLKQSGVSRTRSFTDRITRGQRQILGSSHNHRTPLLRSRIEQAFDLFLARRNGHAILVTGGYAGLVARPYTTHLGLSGILYGRGMVSHSHRAYTLRLLSRPTMLESRDHPGIYFPRRDVDRNGRNHLSSIFLPHDLLLPAVHLLARQTEVYTVRGGRFLMLFQWLDFDHQFKWDLSPGQPIEWTSEKVRKEGPWAFVRTVIYLPSVWLFAGAMYALYIFGWP